MSQIHKAVIPAAGLGTRLLPMTKAIPKEMLPVAGMPVIQHVVEEARAAGMTSVLIILREGKESIRRHFEPDRRLEKFLESTGDLHSLQSIRSIADGIDVQFAWQREPKGLGDAIATAREFTGSDPFAVLLGDAILRPRTALRDLAALHQRVNNSCVLVETVAPDQVSRYGIMDGIMDSRLGAWQVNSWVEKPNPENAPSRLAICARYIFTPAIHDMLSEIEPGRNNELQLTDAMTRLLRSERTHALPLQGTRYDIGTIASWSAAHQALSHDPNQLSENS